MSIKILPVSAIGIAAFLLLTLPVSLAQSLPEELALRIARLTRDFDRTGSPTSAPADELEPCIVALLPYMGAANLPDREPGQQAFEQLAMYAGAPGREAIRSQFSKAAVRQLTPDKPLPARLWILRQLGCMGSAECFPEITACLRDAEPLVREAARRAVQQIASPDSLNALSNLLPALADPSERVAVINALATFDPPPVRVIAPFVEDPNRDVSVAAITALARCQGNEATIPLFALHKNPELEPQKKIATQDALLRLAEDYMNSGDSPRVDNIQKFMASGPAFPALRMAILQSRFSAVQAGFAPDLFAMIESENAEILRKTAARMLAEVAAEIGADIAKRLLAAKPPARVLYIETLAQRNEVAQSSVVEAQLLTATDEPVRIAAIKALAILGNDRHARSLARLAASAEKPVQHAAREALIELRGDATNAQLMQLAKSAEPAERAECIRAIERRACDRPIGELLQLAADPEAAVAKAAFDALAALGSEKDAPALLSALIAAPDTVAGRAENAFVRLAMRNGDLVARAQPVIAAIPTAPVATQARLIRLLGRLGGESALVAIRLAAASKDAELFDAAIRSLAEWPNAEVLPNLKTIAESAESQAHRTLALRGLVRLLRQPSERSANESALWLETAMALATPLNERKLVLSAVGEVKHSKSLAIARGLMSEDSLAPEAAVAALSVARGLAVADAPNAIATIAEVRGNTKCGPAAQKAADDLAAFIESRRGFIGQWEFSGPWSVKDARVAQIYDTAFPPEPGSPTSTQVAPPSNTGWQPLHAHSANDPWQFDLTRVSKDRNCCIYARTTIHAKEPGPAILELGSDDGIMVWVNDKLVHANKSARALTVGEDKVNITLRSGENAILLKIVQGDGGWGFCCAIKSADGKPLQSE